MKFITNYVKKVELGLSMLYNRTAILIKLQGAGSFAGYKKFVAHYK